SALGYEERLNLARWWLRMGAVLALVGLWDFFAPHFGLPALATYLGLWEGFSAQGGAVTGGVTSTFRNTGQAGSFFQVVLSFGLALQPILSRRYKREAVCSCLLLAVAMIFTVKRAAIIGTGLGFLLLLLAHGFRGLGKRLIFMGVVGAIV